MVPNLNLPSIGLCGYFKLEAERKKSGTRRIVADWFPNLVTNNGLDLVGNSSAWLTYCQVGTGSTTPANSDSSLATYLAMTSTHSSTSTGYTSSNPYYVYRQNVYQFGAGVAAGTLAEIGIGASSSGNLFSRALILDSGGSPITVTILSDEYLDATYHIRCYAPTSDGTGSITLNGTSYSWTARAANACSGWYIHENGTADDYSDTIRTAIDGSLGAITDWPSITNWSYLTASSGSYTGGTYQRTRTLSGGLSEGNVSGGIDVVHLRKGMGQFQVGFSPAIPKTSSYIISLTFSNSWTRKSI